MEFYEVVLITLLLLIVGYLAWERVFLLQELSVQFLLSELSSLYIANDDRISAEKENLLMERVGEFFSADYACLKLIHEDYGILPDALTWERPSKDRRSAKDHCKSRNFSIDLFSEEKIIGKFVLRGCPAMGPALLKKKALKTTARYLTQYAIKLYKDEKVYFMAYYDHLTALPNRTFFLEKAKEVLAASDKNEEMTALFFLDLDTFKIINDTLGHEAGDTLLRDVACRLCRIKKFIDIATRYGGDEYLILSRNISHKDHVLKTADSLLKIFQEPFRIQGKNIQITASIGISLYPCHGTTIDELLIKADQAMYDAKAKGKGQYALFTMDGQEVR